MSGWVFAAVSFALGTRVGRRQQRASDIEDLVDGAKTTTVVRDRRKRRSHYDHLIPGNGWECDPANLSPSSSNVSSLMLAREPSFYSSFRPATTDRPLRHSTPGAPGDSEAQRRSLSHQKSLIHIEAAINFLADDEGADVAQALDSLQMAKALDDADTEPVEMIKRTASQFLSAFSTPAHSFSLSDNAPSGRHRHSLDETVAREKSASMPSKLLAWENGGKDYVSTTLRSSKRAAPYVEKPHSAELKAELSKVEQWTGFNVFEFVKLTDGYPLTVLMMHILDKDGLLKAHGIKRERMLAFMGAVESIYHSESNAYHNSMHATDVLQSMYALMGPWGLRRQLNNLELFVCYLAAAVHDVGHPGVSNDFQINTQHPRAKLYNDISVNENHHAATAFRVAEEPGHDIFQSFSTEQFKELRHLLVHVILGTDMANHFASLKQFEAAVSASKSVREWSSTLPLMSLVMHLSDVSNPAKPRPWAVAWAERIVQEFYSQGDQELRRGLPVTAVCDRTQYLLPRSQLGFIEYIVKPLCVAFSELLPEPSPVQEQLMTCLEENRLYWLSLVDDDAAPVAPLGVVYDREIAN